MMTNIFAPNSGYIKPSELKTGDLLFPWNHQLNPEVPVLLSKPKAFSFERELTLEILTDGIFDFEDVLKDLFKKIKETTNNKNNEILGHYSGHVVMIIHENGECYVIEAGATDYTNYRVTINPYYIEAESAQGYDINRMRGWLNRRVAHNEKTWLARLANPHTLDTTVKQTKLVEYAKSLVGRPYGMLDTLKFADDSRIYCSDFIYKCYKEIGIELDDQRTWIWLLASPTLKKLGINITMPLDPAKVAALEALIVYAMGIPRPPALCLPALYYSDKLKRDSKVIHNGAEIIYGVE
jgi:Permuted papain-like amidase enzyme, YaeF/YiiX, C92 family